MDVVVVESPAKAKTINKYLGDGYKVVASYGHVRDLVPKNGAVDPESDFAMTWEVEDRAERAVSAIAGELKKAKRLFLATDPDREGEAISWHLAEILKERKKLEGIEVSRVVFHEITKSAVLDAIANPREINRELVDAYLARRALDYLVGFTLSPVLWRKLPGAKSAGRVQSVALRLICEREAEIEAFKPEEYWSVATEFTTSEGGRFTAELTHLAGEKLGKMGLKDQASADRAVEAIKAGQFKVAEVERKTVRRFPPAPFTTSTLQQESSRKLGLGASRTMRLAQQLYEGVSLGGDTVGLITYMRTDSVNLSQEALTGARSVIQREFGDRYLPKEPRSFKNQAKNAQEAHEAIRPTDLGRLPADVAAYLEDDQRRLYELIWKRAVACQMEAAQLDQTGVDIADGSGKTVLRATGSIMLFDGFLKLYQEGKDDDADEDGNRRLPQLSSGQPLTQGEIKPEQHFTQPPPRFSEASLVKRLEELGIGRPSTYASILQVLQDRDYVRLERKRFMPEDRGRVVTAFLSNFFEKYVEYGFTADLEGKLDEVAEGDLDWKEVLREFWRDFSGAVGGTKEIGIKEVIETLDQDLGQHFFPQTEGGTDPRVCPSCTTGRLGLKLGKFGAFIGCSNYPECKYTRRLVVEGGQDGDAAAEGGERELGKDPSSGKAVTLKRGPYGQYVQLGEAEGKEKPKRVSLPRGLSAADVTLERGLALLALPRELGSHPETGEMITAGIGRFGPYLKVGARFKSLPKDEDVLTVGINRAVDLLASAAASTAVEVGKHPADGKPITLKKGRFGPYVQHGSVRATLKRGTEMSAVTLDMAVALIAEKGGKAPAPKKGAAKKAAKPAADKPAAEKPAKPAAKKKIAKKKPAAE
ncbi:MAG: type I DNA topoisomerase [Rhodospirillaceae bacterium]|nr:type I DNA topoisomerase [Rhodospirillaceae bacterium]